MIKWRLQLIGSWLIIGSGVLAMYGYHENTIVLIGGIGLVALILGEKELKKFIAMAPFIVALAVMAGVGQLLPADWSVSARFFTGVFVFSLLLAGLTALVHSLTGVSKLKLAE